MPQDRIEAFIDDLLIGLYVCIAIVIYDGLVETSPDQIVTKTFFVLVGTVAVAVRRLKK